MPFLPRRARHPLRGLLWLAAILIACLAAEGPASAGMPLLQPAASPHAEETLDPLGRSTPRGAVLGFVGAARRGEFERAAQFLDTRRAPQGAMDLALQLSVVLDRGLRADLDTLSNRPEGALNDDLPIGQDRVGTIKTSGDPLEVLLDRTQRGKDPPIWLFSAETLRRIPRAYEELGDPWLEEHLPRWIAAPRFLSAPLWQWLAFLLSIPLAVVLAWPLNRLLIAVLRVLLRRIPHESEDVLLGRISRPLRLLVLAVTVQAGSLLLPLSLLARQFWTRVSATLVVLALAWLLLRALDFLSDLAQRNARITSRPGNTALLHLARRFFKAAVVVTAALILLYRTGVDLTAALAGLGLGGLAIAFSAQKTLENLFGGIMLISDQTLRVGDFCKIGEHMGTVEDIGLRATRLRTLDRTITNIPNGQLSTMNVENFAWRDKILFKHLIGLRYETTPDQLRHVLSELRRLLYAHPKIETESARIRFIRLGASSLDLEIFSYVREPDYGSFLAIQEDLLLRILEIVEASGTHIAFPSSTTYLARDGGLDPARRRAAEDTVRERRARGAVPFPDFAPEEIAAMQDTLEYPPSDSAQRVPPLPPGADSARGGPRAG